MPIATQIRSQVVNEARINCEHDDKLRTYFQIFTIKNKKNLTKKVPKFIRKKSEHFNKKKFSKFVWKNHQKSSQIYLKKSEKFDQKSSQMYLKKSEKFDQKNPKFIWKSEKNNQTNSTAFRSSHTFGSWKSS